MGWGRPLRLIGTLSPPRGFLGTHFPLKHHVPFSQTTIPITADHETPIYNETIGSCVSISDAIYVFG